MARDDPYGFEAFRRERQSESRGVARWASGVALAFALVALLVFLQLFQLTSDGLAKRTLRRALDAVAEGDAVIARNHDDLRARAESAQPGESLRLRDYPVDVDISRDEALSLSPEELRPVLLERGADRMYDDGIGVLRHDRAVGEPGRFTASGLVKEFLGLLRGRNHTVFGVITAVLAVLACLLALAAVFSARGFGRLVALGVPLLAASGVLLLIGLAARVYAGGSSEDDYIRRELLAIGEDLAWLPLRNGLIFAGLAIAMILVGVVGGLLSQSRAPAADWAPSLRLRDR